MPTVFDAVSSALAGLLGTSTLLAGFILGLAVIIVLLVALSWILGDNMKGSAIFIPAGIAMGFVVLVGWWPMWTIIFVVVIALVVIFKPFGSSVDLG